ncbi:MAG: helix-turn-helix transcriptional regulator [Spirochaetia bacterium]|nr:helix-turn-helix transcriptional regulator [Spirochaetia bacterium]
MIQIRQLETLEDLTKWALNIMDRFVDLVFTLRNVQHTHTVLQVIRYVKQNFSEKVTLAEAAGRVHLSPSYLSKLFKQEMGKPFSEYLNTVRIDEARRMLLHTDSPLGDVAYVCGFEDQSYFTKVFRKVTGTAPSRYRETSGRIRSQGAG